MLIDINGESMMNLPISYSILPYPADPSQTVVNCFIED